MNRVIIIRYGELFLKGKNRNFFENKLKSNIKRRLSPFSCSLEFGRGRYTVTDFSEGEERKIIEALTTVFGIHSLSAGLSVPANLDEITAAALTLIPPSGSFRVNAHRGDKTFSLDSMGIARELGGRLLGARSGLRVDLHKPDFTVSVDVREEGSAFVFGGVIPGAGGLPVGCAGKGLLMLSGGLDSPVAGYMMAKRGLTLDAVHFHSYPYTSELAKEKVVSLARIMQNYCGKINLICVPFTRIQEEIHRRCESNYMITLVRRFMMTISERIALRRGCGCLVNGESLGQVASQTMESITVTNSMVETLPVFRPLIGMDKDEIIAISHKIGTYETSILPYEDCCTVFLPDSPVTRPTVERARAEEKKLANYEELIRDAVENFEVIDIDH